MLNRYFHTLRYLKWIQLRYRIYYLLRSRWRSLNGISDTFEQRYSHCEPIFFQESLAAAKSVHYQDLKFSFLNKTHQFVNEIDWNEASYGKLWTYNLTYFEFLHLPALSKKEGLNLIYDFIQKITQVKDGLEPFPISLRVMNWIKFLAKHKIEDQNINQSLYYQLHLLNENLEYHLLGNHLLENGFALLIGAYYFQDQKLYSQAKKILIPELEEQILSDGAHFELSPMYHQLMLFRVLDSYNLIQNNSFFDQELLGLFKEKASKMLSWLRQMTFSDGSIALLNDSARKIASTTKQLESYAQNLSVPKVDLPLKESGYRRVNNGRYEIILDIGQIGPDYIPGHAHSDTLNFELYIDGKPFIVDTGTSTYEKNARRTLERSTASHNVVQVENLEQSEVWGGFRVGRRASATIIEESNSFITASHNGFKKNGIIHKRSFFFEENVLTIEDEVLSLNTKNVTSNALLHFYPSISLDFHGETIETSLASITFASRNYTIIKEDVYDYAPEFNKRISAKKVSVKFQSKLTTVIQL